MEDNKMYAQEMWKCGICGKTYDSISQRMQCEARCLQRQEEEAKKAAEAKKKEEEDARHDEVTKAIDGAVALLIEYTKDYGHYVYDGKNAHKFDDLLPSKFLHHFLF